MNSLLSCFAFLVVPLILTVSVAHGQTETNGATSDALETSGDETPQEPKYKLDDIFIAPIIDLNDKDVILYLFCMGLCCFYGIIFVGSWQYDGKLSHEVSHEKKYQFYENKHQSIPNLLGIWVLPLISILLVLVTQVANLPDPQTGTEITRGAIPYFLAFTFATSFILLMIGMELSYVSQDNKKEGWIVLVTISLVLDFAAYILLIVGLGLPDLKGDTLVTTTKSIFTFCVGLASLVSSYYWAFAFRYFKANCLDGSASTC